MLVQQTKELSEDELWSELKENVGHGNILTASCIKDYNGLVGGHAYTVLHVQELGGERVIQLRSPVGTEKYIGPFGNADPRWADELRKETKKQQYDSQTVFHMRLPEFKQAFANVDTTFYHGNAEFISKTATVQGTGRDWVFPFQLIAKQQIFLTFDMAAERMMPPGCTFETTRDFNMILRGANGEIVDQQPVSQRTGYGLIKKVLPPGNYQLVVVSFGDADAVSDFAVSTYSDQGVELLQQKAHLAAMLDRAQIASPADVIVSRATANGTALVGRSFLDDTQQVLYIGLNKRSLGQKAVYDRNVTIELDLMTVGSEFPTIGVKASQPKWLQAAELSQIVKVAQEG